MSEELLSKARHYAKLYDIHGGDPESKDLARARDSLLAEAKDDRATICIYCGWVLRYEGDIEAAYEAALAHDAACERNPHLQRARRLEAENQRMHLAIRWALGEYGEFQLRDPTDGAFWWRNELRRRALLAAPETADKVRTEP